MNWRFLTNRYIVTFGSIAIVTGLWNLYIAANDDGIVRGKIVGSDGRPVAGAEVVLSERSLLVTTPRDRVKTNDDGEFVFTGHTFHRIWLEASKPNVGTYPQTEYRMYFKGQNMTLSEPLRLKPDPSPAGNG